MNRPWPQDGGAGTKKGRAPEGAALMFRRSGRSAGGVAVFGDLADVDPVADQLVAISKAGLEIKDAGTRAVIDVDPDPGGCCQVNRVKLKAALSCLKSCNRGRPNGSRLGTTAPKGGSADQMALNVEGVVDRGVGGEESLG